MLTLEDMTLKLPTGLLKQAQVLATARGVGIADMVRQFLEIDSRAHAHSGDSSKEHALRDLAAIFSSAKDWAQLKNDLLARGYALRAQGNGLAIFGSIDGQHLCSTAAIGYRYRKLVRLFGGPMPGHPHAMDWVIPAGSGAQEFNFIDRAP